METDLAIESDQDADTIRSLVDQAERMCFVMNAIEEPHEVVRRSSLNGDAL